MKQHPWYTFAAASALVVASACDRASEPVAPVETGPQFSAVIESFQTSQPAQVIALAAGATVTPIATVGDAMPGSGELLAPLLDGLGGYHDGTNVVLFANHELAGVSASDGSTVFPNSMVSRFVIDPSTAHVVDHTYVIDGTEGYQRLCSATWVDAPEGFNGGFFFTGEETNGGLQLAISREGIVYEMPHLGRYAHENMIALPGFGRNRMLINLDDRGGNGQSLSELYMYFAKSSYDAITGRGALYVFKSDDVADPGALQVSQSITGYWVRVPNEIAQADQNTLQAWVHKAGAFPFVRLEDGDYDRRARERPGFYFVDTGRQSIPNSNGSNPWDPWGSIYYMDFDRANPLHNTTLTLLARSSGPDQMWASPDNIAVNESSLMVQEDPANSPWLRPPAIYHFALTGAGSIADPFGTAVAEVYEADCPGPLCGNLLTWETSGIIDASRWFGPGAWLIDTQAHDKPVAAPLGLAEENGQLLLLRVPGS